jgi:hypothetical protein
LLDVLIKGDGTIHKVKGHKIYYTTSNLLANDILSLATQHGILCRLLGPYQYKKEHLPIYQLMFSKKLLITSGLNKQMKNDKRNGWTINKVKDQRIVCFSVKNSVLITKNKNKVAIQGNSKNMQHTIRLLYESKEIAVNGRPQINWKGRNELTLLREIREGKFKYQYLLDLAEDIRLESKELYDKSSLPSSCTKRKQVNQLYFELVQMNGGVI